METAAFLLIVLGLGVMFAASRFSKARRAYTRLLIESEAALTRASGILDDIADSVEGPPDELSARDWDDVQAALTSLFDKLRAAARNETFPPLLLASILKGRNDMLYAAEHQAYAAGWDGSGSLAEFIARLHQQSKTDWSDPAYRAQKILGRLCLNGNDDPLHPGVEARVLAAYELLVEAHFPYPLAVIAPYIAHYTGSAESKDYERLADAARQWEQGRLEVV